MISTCSVTHCSLPNIDPWPQENLTAIKARCRQEGVSLNSLALAAIQLAMAAVSAEQAGHTGASVDSWAGLRGQLIDVPVNMRHRLDPAMANKHAGFLITEITTKVKTNVKRHSTINLY